MSIPIFLTFSHAVINLWAARRSHLWPHSSAPDNVAHEGVCRPQDRVWTTHPKACPQANHDVDYEPVNQVLIHKEQKVSGTEVQTKLIHEIRDLPRTLDAAVLDLSDEQLDTPYDVGKWTVRQVVHHLADAHTNAFARLKWILTEEHPTIKPYDQDKWAELPDSKLPIDYSMIILHGLHFRFHFLLESLPGESWRRTANHPETGEVSLHDQVEIYAKHGATHVGQIMKLRHARGW
jgi:hypothetical protein